ncbi:polysaccharide lyase family 1 protein [Serendipita vermifera MAFF 305830]|uniref:Polysaccharide lyase family 1 protein n=1 Tax=Serendipita vermifera MAFF 305830 TaxID=933852 RepID=A0A0C3AJG6_SERVB|nr:polysaccharide lyase family 1 protein [Serendipita vermifera MAFF 305830]
MLSRRLPVAALTLVAALILAPLAQAQAGAWEQCGGNEWYSQCLVASATTTTTTTKTTSTTASTSTNTASCNAAADGFASLNGGTTGGAGGTVVTVTTQTDLAKYAAASGKYVIKVSGKITISPKGTEISVASDKTIIGIGTTGEIYEGGLRLIGVKNVIIRNLKIGNTYVPTDYEGKTQDWDAIQMDTASNVWIDHCLLEKAGDGLIDSRLDTTFLTVSYTILRDHNKAFGIGWTENVTSQITIHHNYFLNTNQRNPSADNIRYAHLYNNYLSNVTSYGHYARGSTEMRMENVYFEKVNNPVTKDSTAKLAASGNTYSSCTGTTASNSGTVFTPSTFYSYSLTATAQVPSVVKAQAGPQASICPS